MADKVVKAVRRTRYGEAPPEMRSLDYYEQRRRTLAPGEHALGLADWGPSGQTVEGVLGAFSQGGYRTPPIGSIQYRGMSNLIDALADLLSTGSFAGPTARPPRKRKK